MRGDLGIWRFLTRSNSLHQKLQLNVRSQAQTQYCKKIGKKKTLVLMSTLGHVPENPRHGPNRFNPNAASKFRVRHMRRFMWTQWANAGFIGYTITQALAYLKNNLVI